MFIESFGRKRERNHQSVNLTRSRDRNSWGTPRSHASECGTSSAFRRVSCYQRERNFRDGKLQSMLHLEAVPLSTGQASSGGVDTTRRACHAGTDSFFARVEPRHQAPVFLIHE